MSMRQQLIVVVAVVFATLAVGMNVFAATRAADRNAERTDRVMPIESILDSGVFEAPPLAGSPDDLPPAHSGAPHDPCSWSDTCRDNTGNGQVPQSSNHGRMVSAYAEHIGFVEGQDGPPGALVRDIAQSNVRADAPPRSDRAEERSRNDASTPPGKDKDKDKDR